MRTDGGGQRDRRGGHPATGAEHEQGLASRRPAQEKSARNVVTPTSGRRLPALS